MPDRLGPSWSFAAKNSASDSIMKAMADPVEFKLRSEIIELQQLLKAADVISSGGHAKAFLAVHQVTINGIPDNRRSRKLRAGDVVVIDGEQTITVV